MTWSQNFERDGSLVQNRHQWQKVENEEQLLSFENGN